MIDTNSLRPHRFSHEKRDHKRAGEMTSLAELSDIAGSYRSSNADIVGEVYEPCLRRSSFYRRAAGYFTSGGLASAASGVASLVARGGAMRLVASPQLEAEDVEMLHAGTTNRDDVLESVAARTFGEIEDLLVRDRLNALAWLVARGQLEVKLALRLDDEGRMGRGIYHEKFGIFEDAEGNRVLFSGSGNETVGALVSNFECIKVFISWDDPNGFVAEDSTYFEDLWNDRVPGLRVVSFTRQAARIIQPHQLDQPPAEESARTAADSDGRRLREHQRLAIEGWREHDGRGILAMATGSGKTFTALHVADELARGSNAFFLLVVCPTISLVDQWEREMEARWPRRIRCFESRAAWENQLLGALSKLQLVRRGRLAAITTQATFASEGFQHAIFSRPPDLIIGDEVHNLGAERARAALPERTEYRLGLSATPERPYDEEGSTELFEYFGGVVYEYGLAEAIDDEVLCPYRYTPVPVELTGEETDEYLDLSRAIGRLLNQDDEDAQRSLKNLLIRRARLIASAANKVEALAKVIENLDEPLQRALIYCGDGQVGLEEGVARQIEAVTRRLGGAHRLRTFTYENSRDERRHMLDGLERAEIDALVAIRCLDEGIDVPEVGMAFLLASSATPRQAVQRRGRVLRRAPNKSHARIWDFIVVPPENLSDEDFKPARNLMRRELARVADFCRTAENAAQAESALLDLRARFHLLGATEDDNG